MKKQQNKARCISCAHYDDEAHVCTHEAGLLREIELSESLAEAEHGCKEYSEARFRLTPAAILQIEMEDEFGIDIPIEEAKSIFDRFMKRMEENGYIKDETTD